MSKVPEKVLQFFSDHPWTLLIVLGVAVFITGASGQVPFVPITDRETKYATMAVGVVLGALGFAMAFRSAAKNPFGVEIRSPLTNSKVNAFEEISGKIARRLPKEHQLWLARVYHDGSIYPVQEVTVKSGEWRERIEISVYTREIAAYVIGPVGLAVIDYERQAAARHNEWLDQLKVAKDAKNRYLPPFKRQLITVLDFKKCDSIVVSQR